MRYKLVGTWRGYEVKDTENNMYLERVYKGDFRWVSDYTYAGHYTKKTAMKHVETLRTKKLTEQSEYWTQ